MKTQRWELFWTLAQSVGVRFKIMGMVLGLILLFGAGNTLMGYVSGSATMSEELKLRGVSIARDAAARSADLLLTRNAFALHELLTDTLRHNEDVRYVYVVDPAHRPVAHTFSGGFPLDLLTGLAPDAAGPKVTAVATEEGLVWEASAPILGGRQGFVQVGMSSRRMTTLLGRQARWQLTVTGVMAALGLVCALILTWVLTRPILELVDVTEAVGTGDLSRRATPAAPDEFGRLVASVNRMVENLDRSRRELAAKEKLRLDLLDKVMTVQEDERKRIARELHDETGQSLTSLLLGLKLMNQDADRPETVRNHVEHMRRLVSGTLEEVRRLARELRPSALDDVGLVAALQRYAGDCARTLGIPVDFQVLGCDDYRPPVRVETAIYRIVQEALTNVARHADASAVSVVLELRADAVSAIIEDNGRGMDPELVRPGRERHEGRGLGLFGIQERVALLGGSFTVQSQPGEGTTLFIKIPLEESVGHAAVAGG